MTGHKNSLNVGNMLLCLGFLAALREEGCDAVVSVLSDDPEVDRVRYGDIPAFELVGRPWGRRGRAPVFPVTVAAACLVWTLLGRAVEIVSGSRLRWPWDPAGRAFGRASWSVDLSGDDLTDAYGLTSLLQALFEAVIARCHGCRVAFVAQSVGPFDGALRGTLARAVRACASLATFREEVSLRHWQRLRGGARERETGRLLADLAFLAVSPPAAARADGGPIVVNVSRYLARTVPGAERLAPAALERFSRGWAGLLERLHDRTDREVVLLPHAVQQGAGDDRVFLREILSRCRTGLPVRLIDDEVTADEVRRVVSGASFVISARMHLAITACVCGVPLLALGYSHKYDLLAVDLEGETLRPVVDLAGRTPDQVLREVEQRFGELWSRRARVGDALARHAERSRDLARENVVVLLRAAGSRRP